MFGKISEKVFFILTKKKKCCSISLGRTFVLKKEDYYKKINI